MDLRISLPYSPSPIKIWPRHFFKHFTPIKAGVPLARKGLPTVIVRIKWGVCEKDNKKDDDLNQGIEYID